MAKATLTYDLPEEANIHLIAVTSMDWALAVWNFHQYLCNQLDNAISDNQAEILQDVLDRLNLELENRNLSLNMIE